MPRAPFRPLLEDQYQLFYLAVIDTKIEKCSKICLTSATEFSLLRKKVVSLILKSCQVLNIFTFSPFLRQE